MVVVLDNMEYSTDALAIAAYPYTENDCLTGGTSSASENSDAAYLACDNYTYTYWYASPGATHWWKYDFGSGITKTIVRYSLYQTGSYQGPTAWTFEGSNDNTNWDILDTQTGQTVTPKKYYSITPTGGYRYYRINISAPTTGNIGITEIEMFNGILVRSEPTIKVQGDYSLKCVGTSGNLTNCMRTISSGIDLSAETLLRFSMRAQRTGANVKIGIRDGGVLTEITPVINLSDTWQNILWDISSVPAANKDQIDQIILTIVNADADNVFYLDALRADSVIKNYLIDRGRSRIRTSAISLG